jgi:hypothetical protein
MAFVPEGQADRSQARSAWAPRDFIPGRTRRARLPQRGLSRRDGTIVAWHEVPGTAAIQNSRPVGYGMIRAGARMSEPIRVIGVTKF